MSGIEQIIHGEMTELKLNNASKLNVFTPDMLTALARCCDEIEADENCRVVLITAHLAKAFSAGADINAWAHLESQIFARDWVRGGHRVFDRLARLAKPTIAVVTGHVFGGGLELIAACDIRIMAKDVTIALPEASVGVVPGWSGSQRLSRLLPESVLKEMMLFGRKICARRAYEIGFVAEISAEPLKAAKGVAKHVLSRSNRAIEISKYMIHAGVGEDSAAMIEALGGGMISGSADNVEGIAAFQEKRKPDFGAKRK